MAPTSSMSTLEPRDDHLYGRGVNLFIISVAVTGVAILLVLSRIAARQHIGSRLVSSDHCIIVSLIAAIGLSVSNCISVVHGCGKHASTLSLEDKFITLQAFWACQIFYKFTINFTKLSICLLYLQIFSGRVFRILVYVVMSYVALYGTASIFVTIFQCTPISRQWNKKEPGHCISLTAFWYAGAVANIIGDVAVLILPMRPTWELAIPKRQKIGLIIVFALGSFVCVTSILRFTTLDRGSKAPDQIFGTLNSTIWTTIEANTGIMCACLPMLKAPIMSLCPCIFGRGFYPYTSSSTGGGHGDTSNYPRTNTTSTHDPESGIDSAANGSAGTSRRQGSKERIRSTLANISPSKSGEKYGRLDDHDDVGAAPNGTADPTTAATAAYINGNANANASPTPHQKGKKKARFAAAAANKYSSSGGSTSEDHELRALPSRGVATPAYDHFTSLPVKGEGSRRQGLKMVGKGGEKEVEIVSPD